MRATSSIRSTSRVTSLRRQCGTVTSRPSPPSRDARSRARSRISRAAPRAGRRRRAAARRLASRRRIVVRGGGPGRRRRSSRRPSRAPVSSSISRGGDRLRLHRLLGREALLEAPGRLGAQRRAASRCAGCSARSSSPPPSARAWSSRVDLGARAAHDAGDRRRARRRRRSRTSSASSVRSTSSSVVIFSPSRARRTTSRPPATRSESNACSGWPVSSIT